MIRIINSRNRQAFPLLIDAMYVDRKRVFVDLLGWNIENDGRVERDKFDDEHAQYMVITGDNSSEHLASLRLLRTDRPHLMTEVFPELCEGGVPQGPDIREITRFCVAPRGRAAERRQARNALVRAMTEYGLLTGISSFTAACHMGFLSEVLAAGWDCRPLGMPQLIEGSLVGAMQIHINAHTTGQMLGSWACGPVQLQLAEVESLAA